jgi:DNA-directed RNA polymerase specialized sigma24 family protein
MRTNEGIWLALEGLSPIERAVYVLHWLFDYSPWEVADALNMTESRVIESFERAAARLGIKRSHM